jgi:hypothetical protein
MNDLDLSILGLETDEEELRIPVPQGCPSATSRSLKNCVAVPLDMELPATLEGIDSIRHLWLSARSPSEVAVQAKTLPFGVWMDYAIKLSPKNVNVNAKIDMRAVFAKLGPVKKVTP